MGYTDHEVKSATEIAYVDFAEAYEALKADNKGRTSFTIKELMEEAGYTRENTPRLACLTDEQISTWKISNVKDDNHGKDASGFYGCVIETDQGAIAAFRGSEDMGDLEQLAKDWHESDFGLLNEIMTPQQKQVDAFLNDNKDLLNGYDDLVFAGHSLGGNLADYAAIMSSKYGLDDNMSASYSLDGPGFSDEFIISNFFRIQKVSDKMVHYSASVVGRLLYPIPGQKNYFVEVDESKLDGYFDRHGTKNWVMKGDSFAEGEQDFLSNIGELLSQGAEKLPDYMGNFVIDVICTGWYVYAWSMEKFTDGKGNLNEQGKLLVAGLIAFMKRYPALAGAGALVVLNIIEKVIAVIIAAIVVEWVWESMKKLIAEICEALHKFWNWTTEQIRQLYENLVAALKEIYEALKKTFNKGYQYALANPEILVDTTKLVNYAERVKSANKRLAAVDRRLDSVYKHVRSLEDLVFLASNLRNILAIDIVTSYSWRLNRCESYLRETATYFEDAERNIISKK